MADWDRIITSAPINKTAAVVAGGHGEQAWTPKISECIEHWDAPPICAPLPNGVENLAGRVSGRFRVVSYYGSGKSGARWLVRCVCGAYELRKTKALHADREIGDRCAKCTKLLVLKKRHHFDRTGRHLSDEEKNAL